MNKKIFKGLIYLIIGYTFILGVILTVICLLWNTIVPAVFSGPRLNILEAALLYALFRVLSFDWLKELNRYLIKNTKNQVGSQKGTDKKVHQLLREFIKN
jgi:hypothetical protein